jgi:two-component system, NtrC family, response regulator
MKKNLLIIEDESSVAKQLKWGLMNEYDIVVASDSHLARQMLGSGRFPVATLDMGLPPFPDDPQEGFRLLQEIPSLAPQTKIIVITGHSEEDKAVRAIGLGAADFCAKPVDLDLLKIVLSRTYRLSELEEANRTLRQQEGNTCSLCGMLGVSPAMNKVFTLIRQVSKTDYPVLVYGETGTGKEMAAQAIHQLSRRSQGSLVIINCGAIPENLLESELFGHEKGAFTGAVGQKKGKFETADQGTVFLDEIGELPLHLQVKLLRFLQEGTVERVGGTKPFHLDARIIAATNRDLKEEVRAGTFREDLYFRLNVVPIELPPLKDRPEDIPLLAQHILREETQKLQRGRLSFSPAALGAMTAHPWPGNVREMQNRIRRALTITNDRTLWPRDLDLEEAFPTPPAEQKVMTIQEARDRAELQTIRQALSLTANNITQAAKLPHISRPTLHDLIKKHQITTY